MSWQVKPHPLIHSKSADTKLFRYFSLENVWYFRFSLLFPWIDVKIVDDPTIKLQISAIQMKFWYEERQKVLEVIGRRSFSWWEEHLDLWTQITGRYLLAEEQHKLWLQWGEQREELD